MPLQGITIGILLSVVLGVGVVQAAPGLMLHVSTQGNDGWSGRPPGVNAPGYDGPFRTLERARDEIRKLKAAGPLPEGGVTVELDGGIYELSTTFELTAEDSGTPESPIVYRGRPGESVRLMGGRVVSGWEPVTDAAVLARMDETARGQVWQADLKAQGITDLGTMQAGQSWGASAPGLEVFYNDEPMTLSRETRAM